MTSDDCIAIKTDVILVLVHRRFFFRAAIISQEKQQRDTSRPYFGYGDRHKSSGRFSMRGMGSSWTPT